jgi:hypothetical protein
MAPRLPTLGFFVSMLLFLSLALTLPYRAVLGQEVTGSLQGTVVSPEGKPEPEVRISVTGPYLQGSRETTTDRHGFFQFLALPPGTYALHVTRLGLRALDVRDIVVELGRTTAVGPLRLETQPIELKPVEVQAHALSIDPVHTTAGGTLEASDYAALPVDRDYKSLLTVLPHANDGHRGDAVNVGGATGLENQYYIDGVNVTDSRNAERATSLPYDFVREVDVKTGGYEAQYGRALGAIVNAVTYSGTNDVEGTVFGFAQPGRWAARPRLAPVHAQSEPMNYDYGVRLSGPVLRDRLWYSAAVNPRVDRLEKEVPGIAMYPDRTSAVRFATKLTWRANAATNVELSVFGDPTVRDGVIPTVPGIYTAANPDPLLVREESGGVTTSLRATTTPTRWLLLQGSLAQQRDRNVHDGATARSRSDYLYADWTTGTVSGGRMDKWKEDRGRTSLMLRGTLSLPGHTLATGLDYEDAKVTTEWLETTGHRWDDTTYGVYSSAYSGTFHNRSPALYLQDAWRLTERLTLNAGLRWSTQSLVGESGRTDQRFTGEWQPRVGFSWQPGRVGRQRFFGSYGRFYETIPTNIAVGMFSDWYQTVALYSSDPRQPGAVPYLDIAYVLAESVYAKRLPGLHAENSDEVTLGYERLLGSQGKLTVRGMRRDLRSSFQIGGYMDESGNFVTFVGTPGKGDFSFLPAPKREYTALEVAAEGTWQRLRYRASYVHSRNWGNYPGLYDSDSRPAYDPGFISGFASPHQAVNSTGYLPNDRTHVAKLATTWDTRFGLTTGALLTFESGGPINEFANAPLPWTADTPPLFLVQRGTAGRTPALWNVDLRLAYELTAVGRTRPRIQLDVLHVGNPRRVTRVEEHLYPTADRTMPNPQYKQPTDYQPPMAVRLGMQVGF